MAWRLAVSAARESLPLPASTIFLPGLGIALGSGAMALGGWPTGSPAFMAILVGQLCAYLAACVLVIRRPHQSLGTIVLGGAIGVAAHAPLVAMPELPARDAIRYIWDARVQRSGLNPYEVRPDDLAVAHLHTDLTRRVDAAWLPTIYPPVAQLYFRLVTAASESIAAFRVAATVADAVTMLGVAAILRGARLPAGWSLLYAWHPVLVYESAAGAHLDSAGVALLTLGFLALQRARSAVATLLVVSAALFKPIPLVLLPLLWDRLRPAHALVGAAWAMGATWMVTGGAPPLGSTGTFVDGFRFNGPLFGWLTVALPPRAVAAGAIVIGLLAAGWVRRFRRRDHVDDWASPQAAALLFAPVIYPWYLAWVAPFAVIAGAITPWAWSLGLVAIYPTWWYATRGAPFEVPGPLMALEYAAPAVAVAGGWLAVRSRRCR
ncbi:MAG: hypothetical protein AB7Q16_05380 [Vicinamibacterales bacterium]